MTDKKPDPQPAEDGRQFWYKRNPAEFFASTFDFPWELKTVYGLVLDLIYLDQGSTPDDPHRIATMCGRGMSVRRWNVLRGELIERGKLVAKDGRLFNPRASREFKRQATKRGESETKVTESPEINPGKNAGKKTGKNEPINNPDLFPDNGLGVNGRPPEAANEVPIGPLPARARLEPEPEPEIESAAGVIVAVEKIAAALGQPRGKWWEADYRRMRLEGISLEALLLAASAHDGQPLRGLSALRGLAARKQQDLEWKGKHAHPGGIVGAAITSASFTDAEWEKALGKLLAFGIWSARDMGACPTREGHVVPPGPYERWHGLWVLQGKHPLREGDLSGNIVAYPAERPSPMLRAVWEGTAS